MSTSVGIHEDLKLAQVLQDLALEGYRGPGKAEFESKERYRWLREFGTRLWLGPGYLGTRPGNRDSRADPFRWRLRPILHKVGKPDSDNLSDESDIVRVRDDYGRQP